MTDICRLCASLKTIERMIDITDSKHSIQLKLKRCCQIDLDSKTNDLLPQKACSDCFMQLNKCWLFTEKVIKAQDILKRTFVFELENLQTKCETENIIEDNSSSTYTEIMYAEQEFDDDESKLFNYYFGYLFSYKI